MREDVHGKEKLANEISGEASIAETSGGLLIWKIFSIRCEVAFENGLDEVVVSRVYCRVSKH